MNINSIKQSLNTATARPLFDLLKLVGDRRVEHKVYRMLSDISIVTINDYVCGMEGLPLREVKLSSHGFDVKLQFHNVASGNLELSSLNRLFMAWSVDDVVDLINIADILYVMDSLVVKRKLLEVMRFYSSLPISKHSVRVAYENQFEGDESVSTLKVTIDKTLYEEVYKCEVSEDDENNHSTKRSRFLLLAEFLTDLEESLEEDDEFTEI